MVILTITCVSVYTFTLEHRREIYENRLKDRASIIASIYKKEKNNFSLQEKIVEETPSSLIDESIIIIDYKNNKKYTYFSDTSDTYVFERVTVNRKLNESYELKIKNKTYDFVVKVNSFDKYGFIRLNFLKNLLIGMWIFCLITTSIASWFFVNRILKPISALVSEVNQVDVNRLNARVDEGNGKDELAQLAIKFNEMLNRLEESFNIQKTFVSNASHELKTPLTSITGQIEVTLLKQRTVEEYESLLISLLEDIINLNNLTQKLLDFAHININNVKIPFEEIRIDELVLNIREESISRHKGFKVTVYFENFSDDDNLLLINGNEHLLRTAIINIFDNAYKYSYDKAASLYFRVIDKSVKITIKDFGIGISEEDLKKISEPFYRSSSVMNIRGHGIGLSLSKKIIELHYGNLECTSKINQGSSFTLTLPLI